MGAMHVSRSAVVRIADALDDSIRDLTGPIQTTCPFGRQSEHTVVWAAQEIDLKTWADDWSIQGVEVFGPAIAGLVKRGVASASKGAGAKIGPGGAGSSLGPRGMAPDRVWRAEVVDRQDPREPWTGSAWFLFHAGRDAVGAGDGDRGAASSGWLAIAYQSGVCFLDDRHPQWSVEMEIDYHLNHEYNDR